LTGANLTNGYLINANFTGATLTNAVLAGANLTGSTFKTAILVGANLSGANLTNATLKGATGGSSATITGTVWANTTCPDGTNSNNDGNTCKGHGF
jgi:uncharacterized protein YjbI with pentapeptide repeats